MSSLMGEGSGPKYLFGADLVDELIRNGAHGV